MSRGIRGGDRQRSGDQAPWICFAAQDWWYHNRAHSDFQLMTRLARQRQVLLVNSIGLRLPTPGRSTQVLRRIARKARSVSKLVRRPIPETPGFIVMTPLVIPLYQHRRVRMLNAALVRLQVRLVMALLRIRRPVAFVTIPTAVDVLPGMDVKAVLYNRSDRHSEFPESDQETIAALEADLLRRADRVLYVSHALMAEDLPAVGARGIFIDHGVDLEHFSLRPESEQPAELRLLPHPRIGFFGGLDDYVVDIDLLERLAVEIPEAQLVLIGSATCPMDRFEQYPNVHWFGFQPYSDIPRFGSGFDVAIMPWLDNDWIRLCNPIKLKEYLALGLPVVSIDYPQLHSYDGLVGVARGHREFIAAVRAALQHAGPGTPQQRRNAVLDASWDAVTSRLLMIGEDASSSVH